MIDQIIFDELGADMIVDCDRCEVRGAACGECVITVLLGAPPEGIELDGPDRTALDTLAAAGMVPRLQLVDRSGERRVCRTCQLTPGIGTICTDCAERSTSVDERSTRHAG